MRKANELLSGSAKNFVRMIVFASGIYGSMRAGGLAASGHIIESGIIGVLAYVLIEHLYHELRKTGKPLRETLKGWAIAGAIVIVPLLCLTAIADNLHPTTAPAYSGQMQQLKVDELSLEIPAEMKELPSAGKDNATEPDKEYAAGSDTVAVYVVLDRSEQASEILRAGCDKNKEAECEYAAEKKDDAVLTHMSSNALGTINEADGKIVDCTRYTYYVYHAGTAEKDDAMTKRILDSMRCAE
jgi:hypothetical protein